MVIFVYEVNLALQNVKAVSTASTMVRGRCSPQGNGPHQSIQKEE